jgi:hypothetical protein
MATASARESVAEKLVRQFYEWEPRGRGWQLWDEPVVLEPAFKPFSGHYVSLPSIDDGRKPTFLSSLADGALRWIKGGGTAIEAPASVPPEPEEEPEPEAADYALSRELHVSLPPNTSISKETFERFLLGLASCRYPVSFEVIGSSERVIVQFATASGDEGHLTTQLRSYFPEATLEPHSAFLEKGWTKAQGDSLIAEFGLSKEFMLPLLSIRSFDPDPLAGIVGALSCLRQGEVGMLQVLFQPIHFPWAESMWRAVTFRDGSSFFGDAPEVVNQTKEKLSKPLYAAVLRVAVRGTSEGRSREIARAVAGNFAIFSNPSGNELFPLENDEYEPEDHEEDLLLRRSRRSGMILSTDELISLAHLPSASVRSERLERQAKKTKAAPSVALNHSLVLGENVHMGQTRTVTLSPEQRVRHVHCIGASGTGKSTLLLNMLIQDIERGEGVALLDPHGDLVDHVLARIPPARQSDVILLDPSDEEYVIGFNILSAHSDLEKNLLASDLVSVFRRLSTSWGDQMTSVLGNAVLAFLESDRGGTLSDLRRFLIEDRFRAEFLKTVKDPEVVYYWTQAYRYVSGRSQGSIITRLDAFLRPKPIRYMVSQKENRLDFAEIMNSGKILLAKLSQGAIGEENAQLLGSLLVSKFHQLVMGRQQAKEEDRRPFWLYIDEFAHFVTPSMATLLSGARKYRLGLVLAHHDIQQLESRDQNVLSAVLSNAGTRVCFRVGDQDAKKLESGFSFFKAQDLQNLGTGEAICRMERADFDFNMTTRLLPELDRDLACERQAQVIAASRARYAVPRQTIEVEVAPGVKPLPEPEPQARPPARQEVPPPEPRSIPSPEPASPAPPPQPRPRPSEAMLGRGGKGHVALQQKIKAYSAGMGYRATIEQPILDGKGSVDVALEKGQETIACQISVTTPVEQEITNVQKCLSAGFKYIVLICEDHKKLGQLRRAATAAVPEQDSERLRFFSDYDEFVSFIQELTAKSVSGTETRVNGFRVTRNYVPLANKDDEAVRLQNTYKAALTPRTKKRTGSDKKEGPDGATTA